MINIPVDHLIDYLSERSRGLAVISFCLRLPFHFYSRTTAPSIQDLYFWFLTPKQLPENNALVKGRRKIRRRVGAAPALAALSRGGVGGRASLPCSPADPEFGFQQPDKLLICPCYPGSWTQLISNNYSPRGLERSLCLLLALPLRGTEVSI